MLLTVTCLFASFIGAQPPELPVVPPLVGALHDPDVETLAFAGMALAQLGPVVVEPLLTTLKDPDYVARAGAAYALGQLGAEAGPAKGQLLAALKDDHKEVRRQAAYALNRLLTAERGRAPATTELPPVLPPPVPAFPTEGPPK